MRPAPCRTSIPTRWSGQAAAALILNGPMTKQERWEENEGYSPSSLAAAIAALICAATFAAENSDPGLATFFTEYADFLESHLEEWTVAKDCAFLRNVPHYIRILPTFVKGDASRAGPLGVAAKPAPDGDPNEAVVSVANRNNLQIAARDLLDPGFLELVRFGIRPADDPVITGSVRAIDAPEARIKVDFAEPSGRSGPAWHRYNEDGYGNYADGRPFDGSGRGDHGHCLRANAGTTSLPPAGTRASISVPWKISPNRQGLLLSNYGTYRAVAS